MLWCCIYMQLQEARYLIEPPKNERRRRRRHRLPSRFKECSSSDRLGRLTHRLASTPGTARAWRASGSGSGCWRRERRSCLLRGTLQRGPTTTANPRRAPSSGGCAPKGTPAGQAFKEVFEDTNALDPEGRRELQEGRAEFVAEIGHRAHESLRPCLRAD